MPKRSFDEMEQGGKMPREWISTLNNYTSEDVAEFDSWCAANCSFAHVGYEVGASGTPHLQGFHQMRTRLTFERGLIIFFCIY